MTFKELVSFSNDALFYNHYSFERVLELNQMRYCIIIILSEYKDINEVY